MYLVRMVDGPAKGWEYRVAIKPDPRIGVAPIPRVRSSFKTPRLDEVNRDLAGKFMRTLLDAPPWPEQRVYQFKAIGTSEGSDRVLEYELAKTTS